MIARPRRAGFWFRFCSAVRYYGPDTITGFLLFGFLLILLPVLF